MIICKQGIQKSNQIQVQVYNNQIGMQQFDKIIVLLKDFQFSPTRINANTNQTIVVRIGNNNRGYSSVYQTQSRPFILLIQELQIQTSPLNFRDEYSFQIAVPGQYTMECLNYSKLTLKITVAGIDKQSSLQSYKKNKSHSEYSKHNQQEFNKINYEEFEVMINSLNFNMLEEIPQYLMNCFQREINLLQEINNLEYNDQSVHNKEDTNCQSIHSKENQQFSNQEILALQVFKQKKSNSCKGDTLNVAQIQGYEMHPLKHDKFYSGVQAYLKDKKNQQIEIKRMTKHQKIQKIRILLENRFWWISYSE